METTPRFEKAISNLYPAFHNGALNAFDCKACAVGNMCNNNDQWYLLRRRMGGKGEFISLSTSVEHNTVLLGYNDLMKSGYIKEQIKENYKKGFNLVKDTGYSVEEIIEVENLFMEPFMGASGNLLVRGKNKDLQFQGLCNVIEYLASLDNIPNPMDYSKVFETTEENTPKYKLEEVLT